MSPSQARRMAARLRSGELVTDVPEVSPELLAEWLEIAVENDALLRARMDDIRAVLELKQRFEQRYAAERRHSFVLRFERLKESPEAHDPESKAAERLRRLHRVRRQESGRSRGRKKSRGAKLKRLLRKRRRR